MDISQSSTARTLVASTGRAWCCRCGSRRARSRFDSAGGTALPSAACRSSRRRRADRHEVLIRSHCPPQRRTWRFRYPVGLAEVAEPDGVRVDRVQVGQHLDSASTHALMVCLIAERRQFVGVAGSPSRHVLDHLERRAEHRVVVAHRHARATGTGVSSTTATTRYSRAMSWADGVSPCNGGRRSTHFESSSRTRKVRFDRPPAISPREVHPRGRDAHCPEAAAQRGQVQAVRWTSPAPRRSLP